MGLAIDAGKRAADATTRNLTFVAVTFLVTLVMTGVVLVLNVVPLVGPMVGNVLVVPVALAGMIAMADAALDGPAALDDFTGGVSEFWKSMVGAYGILYCATVAVLIVLVVIFAVLGVFALGLGSAGGASVVDSGADVPSLFAGLGLAFLGVFLLLGLVAVVVGLVIQFLPAAVVVGGESATGAFGACWRVFRGQPLSVIGYSLLLGGSWIAAFVAVAVLYGVGVTVGDDTVALLLAGVVGLAVFPFVQAFLVAYQASFYRSATAA